jgi:hypothetical protein
MADTNMIASYQEAANQLFEAMDLITSKRVNALGFDKTLICTIESVENSKNGMYRVTDGVSHFNAYSDTDTIYTEGLKVYVKVPNGDMNSQKIITGKYVSTENQYVSYVSPLNSFVDITSNIIADRLQFSLKANDERKIITVWEYQPDLVYSEELRRARKIEIDKDTTSLKEQRIENYNSYQTPRILLDNISSNNDLTPMEKTILSQDIIAMTVSSGFKGYNRLGISGDFKTLLDYRTKDGSYGLRLDILGINQNGLQEIKRYYLDSSDMYGNPYQYSTFYKQEYLYDISNLQEILNIRLLFYQNSDFILEDGTPINPADTKGRDDIILQAPYIAFGYDLNNFTEDKVLIGTHDSLMYSNNIIPKERKVYTRWVHKIEDKFYALDESTETPENAIIHWYRYKLEENRNDELAGPFWKEFNPGEDKYNYKFEPDTTTDIDAFKVIIEIPSREIVTQDLGANVNLLQTWAKLLETTGSPQGLTDGISSMVETTDLSFVEETYDLLKAQYITNDEQAQLFSEIHNIITEERARTQYYSSDVLTFTNAIPQTLEAIDLIQSLSITADEGNYEGVYRLYDETYHIINSTEASKQRILKANYSSVVTGITELDSAEEITWYFPKEQSMIQLPVEGKEYSIENGDEYIENCGRSGYVAIRRTGTDTVEQLEPGLSLIETTQTFRIKEHYTQSASTNIIYCTVKKRDKLYEASVVLYFGTTGSNGTEATFLLKMYDENGVDEVSALTIGKKVIIKPELYNFNNQPLYINSISYNWKEKNSSDVIQMVKSGNELSLTIEDETDISNCQFYILQASTPYTIITDIDKDGEEKKREVNLTAFLPIPVRISDEFVEIEGATKIVYDSNGTNPRYYKNPYKLYTYQLSQVNNINWDIYSEDFERLTDEDGNILTSAKRYYPTIQPTGEFMPTKMYYTGLSPVSVNAYLDGMVVWTQPLLIIQNKYASAMLNDWDGNLTIDEKNGTILSAMMGAGIKNEDNSFSGIVMGDMGKVSDNFDPNNKTGIGLYGLDHGAQSYGFNVDGTAFIGKSGKGRINFDGINGTITSGNYEEDVAGMQIDLDDPFLKAYGDAGSFEMELSKEDKSLLLIKGYDINNILQPLFNVGTEDYFLRSVDFSKDNYTGVDFNLADGKLTGYNFELYTANRIADGLISSITVASNGNPYFKIHHASLETYENVPVFKIYEPNTYYYFNLDEELELDKSTEYTEGRVYYNADGRALNIVDKRKVYGKYGNVFFFLNESEKTSYFELVPSFVNNIQYYLEENLDSKITVIDGAYRYEPNKYYTISENNTYIIDSSEYYTPGRIYFDENHQEVSGVLDNKIYKVFSEVRKDGILYYQAEGDYVLDTSDNYTPNRIYYRSSTGTSVVKIVPNSQPIFEAGRYYYQVGSQRYEKANNYNSNIIYYESVTTHSDGTQTPHNPIANMASPDSERYRPNRFYYYKDSTWELVNINDEYNAELSYAILENGVYNSSYFITNSENVYKANKYYYIDGYNINYDLSTSYNKSVQYFIEENGKKVAVRVVQETDTLKIFEPNKFYRYYTFTGAYAEADGDYNPLKVYYTYIPNEDEGTYEPVELVDNRYEFEENKFYVYNENNDGYILASTFLDSQYYIISNEKQKNDLVKITKNKFELKSHDWNISNRIGMHFDIASAGGYIEGYSEYVNTSGEIIKPKFILDWRKNRDPINVNDGVFKVKWNGETICTNIRATGGRIGGWKIDNNQIIGNNIVLYCSSELSAIYAGPKAKNFVDFIVTKQTVDTSNATVSDTLEFEEKDWNALGMTNDDKYFYVNDDGVLEAYMAQIQYLKAKTLYVENMYLGKRQVQWKNKEIVIATKSSKTSVLTSVTVKSKNIGHSHKISSPGTSTTTMGMSKNYDHSHDVSKSTVSVVSSSSDTRDQIVYLG